MRRHMAAAICLATLCACTSSVGGTASSRSSMTDSSTPPTMSASTSRTPSPTRPREIRLDGKNPCDLMTAEQLAPIAPTTAPRPNTSSFLNAPNCDFSATGAFWTVTIVTTEGMEEWTSGKRAGQATEIPPIAGFPAITVTLPTDRAACDIAIDVANGQYLFSGFEVGKSFADTFPKPCEGARVGAEAVIQNLLK
ncbi:MAG TPA: DUF3558 domain-containing protein [Umezawaea sp.]|nr:DUF3558 domain-containing protein [Umezawaea sp.]